jgi:hypothetical protein
MADNSLTIDRNRFLALVLKSPTQMGWLSIINSVTNISRLGTFNSSSGCGGRGVYPVFLKSRAALEKVGLFWKKPYFFFKRLKLDNLKKVGLFPKKPYFFQKKPYFFD